MTKSTLKKGKAKGVVAAILTFILVVSLLPVAIVLASGAVTVERQYGNTTITVVNPTGLRQYVAGQFDFPAGNAGIVTVFPYIGGWTFNDFATFLSVADTLGYDVIEMSSSRIRVRHRYLQEPRWPSEGSGGWNPIEGPGDNWQPIEVEPDVIFGSISRIYRVYGVQRVRVNNPHIGINTQGRWEFRDGNAHVTTVFPRTDGWNFERGATFVFVADVLDYEIFLEGSTMLLRHRTLTQPPPTQPVATRFVVNDMRVIIPYTMGVNGRTTTGGEFVAAFGNYFPSNVRRPATGEIVNVNELARAIGFTVTEYRGHVFFRNDGRIPTMVFLHGTPVFFLDVQPVIINGYTMVPMRSIAYAAGWQIHWVARYNLVTIWNSQNSAQITIGRTIMTANGRPITLQTPAQIVRERTVIPVRATGEAFGLHVRWDPTPTINRIWLE